MPRETLSKFQSYYIQTVIFKYFGGKLLSQLKLQLLSFLTLPKLEVAMSYSHMVLGIVRRVAVKQPIILRYDRKEGSHVRSTNPSHSSYSTVTVEKLYSGPLFRSLLQIPV